MAKPEQPTQTPKSWDTETPFSIEEQKLYVWRRAKLTPEQALTPEGMQKLRVEGLRALLGSLTPRERSFWANLLDVD